MKAEVVSMTADRLDMEAIRGGVSDRDGVWSWWGCFESTGVYENLCCEGQTVG